MESNTDDDFQFLFLEILPEVFNLSSKPWEKLSTITQKVLKRKFPHQADIAGEVYARNILPSKRSVGFKFDILKYFWDKILNAIKEAFKANKATTCTGGDFIPIDLFGGLSKQALGKVRTTALPVVCSLLIEAFFLYKKSHNQKLGPEEWHGLLGQSMMTVISNGAVNCALAFFAGPVGWAACGAKLVVSGVVSYLSGKAGYDIGYSCS